MTQGWSINATADTITFNEPVLGTSTVVVNEYASGGINATAIWALGAWGPAYGYPSVVEFYSDRLCFAATPTDPQGMNASRIGDYTMFGRETPMIDSDPFASVMNARQLNAIVALLAKQDLLAATSGGIWKIGDSAEALTAGTVQSTPQPSVGSAPLQPLDSGETAIYLTHMGGEVRDLTYTFETDGYAGSDLTAFATHLLQGKSIVSWAWCPVPWSAVFAVLSDGTFLTMTYKREHQVVAWSRHSTEGGLYKQVETVPEDTQFGVYFAVERANGTFVERLGDQYVSDWREWVGDDSALTYDGRNATATVLTLSGGATVDDEVTITASASLFVASNVGDQIVLHYDSEPVRVSIVARDSATVVRGYALSRPLVDADLTPGTNWALAVDTLSGLDHLEGEEVRCAADGYDLGQYTVTGGSISPAEPVVLAHVGKRKEAEFESLDLMLIGGQPVSTTTKKITSVGFLTRQTNRIDVSVDNGKIWYPMESRENENMGVPAERKTKWESARVGGNWKQDPRVLIRARGPYAASVLAVQPETEFGS
jgi:hypothetical protein